MTAWVRELVDPDGTVWSRSVHAGTPRIGFGEAPSRHVPGSVERVRPATPAEVAVLGAARSARLPDINDGGSVPSRTEGTTT